MSGIRVDPAEVGPRIGAALGSAAAALAAPAAITPPIPPGADPVSVAAANQVAVRAGRLSAELANGITRVSEGSEAVTAALGRYVGGDADGAARISEDGAGLGAGAAQAAVAAVNLPAAPQVQIPDLPTDMTAALAAIPSEPASVDDALRAGAGEAGMEAHAAAWDGAAAQLSSSAATLRSLAASLPSSWNGQAGAQLSARLQSFGQWMDDGAMSAAAQAAAARQVGAYWRAAVAEHPRAEQVRATYTKLLEAAQRGNVVEVAEYEQAIERAREISASTLNSYGQGAGGTNDQVNNPGDSPRISGDGEQLPDQPAGELGAIEEVAADDDLDALGGSVEDLGETAGQSAQGAISALTQIPSMVANAASQSLSQAGQALQQAGQQASQAASQLGNVLGGAATPSGGSGLGNAGRNPLGKLGSGADGLSGLGGGGLGGGRTMPASLPEQSPPPAAAPPAAASSTMTGTPGQRGPGSAGTGMRMGMGMMPMGMGRGGGGDGGKEMPRNKEWFPDEPLVADEAKVTDPVSGQRRRARPSET